MPIMRTGHPDIDQATAEIAVLLRDAGFGRKDQDRYDEAMRLRDEIIIGALAKAGALPKWVPVNNGASKRSYFLIRGHGQESELVPLRRRYHVGPSGQLIRYAGHETAQRAADKLNLAELGNDLGRSLAREAE